MFRTIVILGVLAVCAFMAGWFTIDRDENQTTIRFDRNEIREDASKAIAKGRELLNKDGGAAGEEAGTAMDVYSGQPDALYIPELQTGDAPFNGGQYNSGQYGDGGFGGDYGTPAPQQAQRPVPPWE